MYKLEVVRKGSVCEDAPKYVSPDKIYHQFRKMCELDREHFVVLHLDGKNRLIAKETISVGTLNQSIIHSREVFKGAVLHNSAALILLHNHPTGDPKPSPEDLAITRRLKRCGNLLGIPVLDHIIIGENSFVSLTAMRMEFSILR